MLSQCLYFANYYLRRGLDQKGPQSTEDLLDTLQQWWAIKSSMPGEDSSKPRIAAPQQNRYGSVRCYVCNKQGLKSFECHQKSNTSSIPASPPATKVVNNNWTCFHCYKKGHQDCPGGHRSNFGATPKSSSLSATGEATVSYGRYNLERKEVSV